MKTFGQFVDAEPGNAPAGFLCPVFFPSLGKVDNRTRDGRLIFGDSFEPFELPRTIQVCTKSEGAHFGAEPAGRIDEVTIEDDGNLTGRGWMLADAVGSRAAYLLKTQAMRGNSMDLSVAEKDVDIVIEEDPETGDFTFQIDFRNARMAATTLLTTPAFDDSFAEIPEGWEVPGVPEPEAEAIVAALAMNEPSAKEALLSFSIVKERPKLDHEAFTNPGLTELTPIWVDEHDRVFGHLAGWNTPHLNADGVVPPRSYSDYSFFANKAVLTTEGFVSTGPLTINGDHAAKTLGWRETMDHYANSCLAWADVCIGEDEHGIWFAGLVRPGTSDELVHAGRASGLSGDWRAVGHQLELVAALSVNVDGFPKPRARSFAHTEGLTLSLTGAGALAPRGLSVPRVSTTLAADPHVEYLAQRFATLEARELLDAWGDDD